MTRTEVLAIEVKQYTDAAGEQQTIVPRLIGDTTEARVTKRPGAGAFVFNRDRLVAALAHQTEEAASAAEAILDWAEQQPQLEVHWTRAADVSVGGTEPLLRLWPDGSVEVRLETLRHHPAGWDDARIEQFATRLNEIDVGVQVGSR